MGSRRVLGNDPFQRGAAQRTPARAEPPDEAPAPGATPVVPEAQSSPVASHARSRARREPSERPPSPPTGFPPGASTPPPSPPRPPMPPAGSVVPEPAAARAPRPPTTPSAPPESPPGVPERGAAPSSLTWTPLPEAVPERSGAAVAQAARMVDESGVSPASPGRAPPPPSSRRSARPPVSWPRRGRRSRRRPGPSVPGSEPAEVISSTCTAATPG